MAKVFLIGDSIRMGYQEPVAIRLADRAQVIGPEQNCGDSRRVLAGLEGWLGGLDPNVVHLNCGLHDLKIERGSGDFQVPPDEYERNVGKILDRVRKLAPGARIIWAATTPVIDERHQARKEFDRRQSDVERYNALAANLALSVGVEIDDLHAVIDRVGREQAIGDDGVHMADLGNRALADAVAGCIGG